MRGLSGESNMGVSNQVYFNKNENQKNTASHGIKGIKDPLASRGKVDIFENFIEAIKPKKRVISILTYMRSMFPVVYATWPIFLSGEKSSFSKEKNAFGENKQAYEYFERMQDHLKENGLKLEETEYIVGRNLKFDSKSESIIGDKEANDLLIKLSRSPYIVRKRFSQLVILNQTRFNIPE